MVAWITYILSISYLAFEVYLLAARRRRGPKTSELESACYNPKTRKESVPESVPSPFLLRLESEDRIARRSCIYAALWGAAPGRARTCNPMIRSHKVASGNAARVR